MPPKGSSSKRIRMRDVANRCGVSISTVSLVLSGDPRIPEDTTRRVLQAVKALEYRPSVVARNLARRSSRTLGVILPEFGFSQNQPFFYQAMQGIHSQTQPAGYKLVVEAANKGFLERRYYLRLLKEQSVDGLIYMAAGVNDTFLSEMSAEPYPFALLGSVVDGVDLPTAKGDDGAGAKMAVDHLVSLGHKKIGHIAGPAATSFARDREAGYRQAMKKAGIQVEEGWVIPGNFDLKESEQAAIKLIKNGVTAIFAGSDVMAYAALRGIRKQGKKIPNDISLIGMDDLEMSSWMEPSLTTVRYNISEIAATAAKYIIAKIQSPLIKKSLLDSVPKPELIKRNSTSQA